MKQQQPPIAMNFKYSSLLLASIALLASTSVSAQCKKFSKKRVISTIQGKQSIDQITSGTLGRGESAAALIEVTTTGEVDLIISTHPNLGEVTYNVVTTNGQSLASGSSRGSIARLPISVEAHSDIIVHVQSEKTSSAYIPIGCVAMATTKVTPNEMDILTGE